MILPVKNIRGKLSDFKKFFNGKHSQKDELIIRVILATFVALFLTTSYLVFRNLQKPLIEGKPNFNTFELPDATVNTPYKTSIIGTLPFHGTLTIGAIGLPDGLKIENCISKFDVEVVKVHPNTLTQCDLKGTPSKDGSYNVSFILQSPDNLSAFVSRQPIKVLSASAPQSNLTPN